MYVLYLVRVVAYEPEMKNASGRFFRFSFLLLKNRLVSVGFEIVIEAEPNTFRSVSPSVSRRSQPSAQRFIGLGVNVLVSCVDNDRMVSWCHVVREKVVGRFFVLIFLPKV